MTAATKARQAAKAEGALDHGEILAKAEEALSALRERVGSGDQTVTADELASAEDAVHLAELRIAAAAEIAVREAEERRQARIAEIRRSLTSGALEAQASAVVECFDKAVAACAELYRRKAAYEADLTALLSELSRLGPMPGDLRMSGMGGPQHRSVSIDRRTWRPTSSTNVALIAEAAAVGIETAGGGRGDLHKAVGSSSPAARLRRFAGAPEPKDAA